MVDPGPQKPSWSIWREVEERVSSCRDLTFSSTSLQIQQDDFSGSGSNITRGQGLCCLQATSLQRYYSHFGTGQQSSCSSVRSTDISCKRSHRSGSSSEKWVRLLQPLFLVHKKDVGLRPFFNLRHLNHLLMRQHSRCQLWNRSSRKFRGLVSVCGSERHILSCPNSPSSQTFLEIRIQGSGLSIHSPAIWAVPSPSHFYEVHEHVSFPSETDISILNYLDN